MTRDFPISLIQSSSAVTKLAWVTKDDTIISIEHWLYNKWRAGDISAFIIKEPAFGGNGYLGIFAPNHKNETIAWLRTKAKYKKGQWLNTTIVSLPREYTKHMVVTDSIILKGRYCHIFDIRYATKSQKLKSACINIVNDQLIKSNLFASIQSFEHGNLINTENINYELNYLMKNIDLLNEAISKRNSIIWQEEPAYAVLRCCHNKIHYDSIEIKNKLFSIAKSLWHDTIKFISSSKENINLDSYLEPYRNQKYEFILSDSSKVTFFNNKAITAIDIDKRISTWSSKQLNNLIFEICSILYIMRIGGRIIIDIPKTPSKFRQEITSLWKNKKKINPHPVADDSHSDVVQRIALDCLTPAGLLVLYQQSYDRSLFSLYELSKINEEYLNSNEPLIIAHDILLDIKNKISKAKLLNNIKINLPKVCYLLLQNEFSKEWNQSIDLCGSTVCIKINKNINDFTWSITI